ncbi:MAG: hypothetical protein J3K34DRAFT_523977 [Monoraphidium minutum]|nr:MAG: hypothetical protein J3K34DRAFT_523977 [Monoraphidium minutum]
MDVVDLLGSSDEEQAAGPGAGPLAAAPAPAAAPPPPPPPPPAAAADGTSAGGGDDELEGAGCLICYEPMTDAAPHRAATLRCGHLFGEDCIRRWLSEGHKRCPTCNQKAKPRDVTPLFNLPVAVAAAPPPPSAGDAAALAGLRRELEEERARRAALQAQLQHQQQQQQQQQQRGPGGSWTSGGAAAPDVAGGGGRSSMAPAPEAAPQGPALRLVPLPPWDPAAAPAGGAGYARAAPGGLQLAQVYKCSGTRALSLQGSTLLLAESMPAAGGGGGGGGGDQRLRRVSILMPGSSSYVPLPGAGRVCAVAPQPAAGGGGGGGGLVAVGTQGAGLLVVSPSSGAVVHRVPPPAVGCVWSAAWSAACDQQLLLGLDRGRLALVDLRMTRSDHKGLVALAAAPGVQQPLLRVAAAPMGGSGGAAALAAAPGGVYAWSERGGGFTQLLDARAAHGGNCESVAVHGGGGGGESEQPVVAVSLRSRLSAAGEAEPPAPAAHLLFRLAPADGAAAAPAAAAALGQAARLAGHVSRAVVTAGEFVPLPGAAGGAEALAFFSGDEAGPAVAGWDCATGARAGGGCCALPGPVLQVAASPRGGGGGMPLVGALCESQLALWRWEPAGAGAGVVSWS